MVLLKPRRPSRTNPPKRLMPYSSLLHPELHPCGSPLLTRTSTGDTQMQFCLSLCGVSGSWCAQDLSEPSEHLWWEWGVILNVNLLLLSSCWGFSFDLGRGVSPQGCSSAANLWLQHRATAIPATYHQRHHVGC